MMVNVWAWIAVAVGPLAKRVLLALGIGWVTYAGLTLAFNAVKDAIVANLGEMTGAAAQMFNYFAFPDCIGIVLGGLLARVALMSYSRLGRVAA